jgi:hypothetical protein
MSLKEAIQCLALCCVYIGLYLKVINITFPFLLQRKHICNGPRKNKNHDSFTLFCWSFVIFNILKLNGNYVYIVFIQNL